MNDLLRSTSPNGWSFWIDRGGTFTDVVARDAGGTLHTRKLLSDNAEVYDDAALHAIRGFLGLSDDQAFPPELINCVKMGTTVATNALLEKKGDRTLLAVTAGFKDVLEIGYQARPRIFDLNIKKPDLVYQGVVEIRERILHDGQIEIPLDEEATRAALQCAFDEGYRAIAIVLMHAFNFADHELRVGALASECGFTQISMSHDVSALAKIVSRGETTVVDAYLTPILSRYVDRISGELNSCDKAGRLLFMQSSGSLVDARHFRGRDAILSGPAGGVVGAVHTARLAGFENVIGFDMGGTSTDVFHYAGEFEKAYETEVAGVRMRVPMMYVHTVAAGGGSLLKYENDRFRVGPESAGANPGPISYRRGGELALTDANVCLGRIQPNHFPSIFGPGQNEQLDRDAAVSAFRSLAERRGNRATAESIAEGYLEVAVEHMAQAIKKISISRGYDVRGYVLNCFGGAGGQHACLVADQLGIETIFLHPLSGVLSAYGMGLASIGTESQRVIERALASALISDLNAAADELIENNTNALSEQGLQAADIEHRMFAMVRYAGTETTFKVSVSNAAIMKSDFETLHKKRFGFIAPKELIVEILIVESVGGGAEIAEPIDAIELKRTLPYNETAKMYSQGTWVDAAIHPIEMLRHGDILIGPAIVVEPNGTIIVEKGWTGSVNAHRHLVLKRSGATAGRKISSETCDPVALELFANGFMSIAEQMGLVLQNTSQSVNVKERLDFSCAIFNHEGDLIANAPHVPVHLGSMDWTVKGLIESGIPISPGDVFVQNNPFKGGSHLPDLTVISPVFDQAGLVPIFYVASRAHHEDIGGIAPGSMSPRARTIYEEGVILDNVKIVHQGVFQRDLIHSHLTDAPYPARNVEQNIADMMAQAAANQTGATELLKMINRYGLHVVGAYAEHVQSAGEAAIKQVIGTLHDGTFEYKMDSGHVIRVSVNIDRNRGEAVVDFTGTSGQLANNLNAPAAITRAAVLYVFRCLVDADIPLNAGCMRPITLVVPDGSMLNPAFPAAVVAGNVETSQAVTNALFAALGALGSSQGTMNNLTFGNERFQYYETICSGSPAGPGFNGVAAVHTHMTNTRMTDPEILEQRYPVVLEEFSIRNNSGGKGQWTAGDGIIRRIRFLEEMECSILSGHRTVPPPGVLGGEDGQIGRNWIERADGSVQELDGCDSADVGPGDSINIQSPTGGGFGRGG